ncbi:MAG: MBL fold metallo-hydrolase, partial [Candidatus Binatia bacterium]
MTRYVLHLARSSLGVARAAACHPRLSLGRGEIGITYVGHATVLIEMDGVTLLTDPVLSERLFVLRRLVSPGVPDGGLPPIDVVLVSHGHHDHLDVPTHRRLRKDGTIAVVAENLSDLLRGSGYERVVELGWGGVLEHKGIRIRALEV